MNLRSNLMPALVGCLVVGAGCQRSGSYHLHVVFPDEEARLLVDEVVLYAIEPGVHSCEDLVGGRASVDDENVLARHSIPHPPVGSSRFPLVPARKLLFFTEGLMGGESLLLRGCTAAEVKAGARVEVTVLLEWVCRPDPAGEIPQNGKDDDCGSSSCNQPQASMWEYDGTDWQLLCSDCPPGPRQAHGLAYTA
jgi:hypothetical protein